MTDTHPREFTVRLNVTGYADVHVTADDEDEAAKLAEQYDPWDLDVQVSGAIVEEVMPLDEDGDEVEA